jgi:hypothetical protein
VVGSCEHDNNFSESINCWKFLEWLSDYFVFERDSFPLSSYTGIGKLSLWFTRKDAMKRHGRMEVQFRAFLISALDTNKWPD